MRQPKWCLLHSLHARPSAWHRVRTCLFTTKAIYCVIRSTGIDVSNDASYLHAVALVHEFCAVDFEILCTPQRKAKEHKLRRRSLGEIVITMVTYIDDDKFDSNEDHSAARIPLLLSSEGDRCLRTSFDKVSEACAHSIKAVDGLKAPKDLNALLPTRMCGIVLSWLIALAGVLCFFKMLMTRRKRYAFKKIIGAIRSSPELRAQVERVAGVKLPEPLRYCCWRNLLFALNPFSLLLFLLLGPAWALLIVSFVFVCAVVTRHSSPVNYTHASATNGTKQNQACGSYVAPVLLHSKEERPKLLV